MSQAKSQPLSLRGNEATVAISSTSDSGSSSNPDPTSSPEGATDISPGRQPWVHGRLTQGSPGGAKEPFDYNAIAGQYDSHRCGRGPFFPVLVRLAEASKATRVLELGCGTGNSAGAFLDAYPCALTGIDRAPRMLARGCDPKGLRYIRLRYCKNTYSVRKIECEVSTRTRTAFQDT